MSKAFDMARKMDVAKLIRDLGGVSLIVFNLRGIGIEDITPKAIEKWRERRAIPMKRWLQLAEMHKKISGKTLVLSKYTRD